jgi:hypothetical protein
MKQLCYVSYLNDDLDIKDVVESIEKISKVKNVKYGLTGKLIYSNEIFIQLLEGKDVNVDVTYSMIKNDNRHSGTKILFEQEAEERSYPEWSMKFDFTEKIDLNTINKLLSAANEDQKKVIMSKSDILELFEKFAKSNIKL